MPLLPKEIIKTIIAGMIGGAAGGFLFSLLLKNSGNENGKV